MFKFQEWILNKVQSINLEKYVSTIIHGKDIFKYIKIDKMYFKYKCTIKMLCETLPFKINQDRFLVLQKVI